MILLHFCLHRLPSLSREAFQSYWKEKHAPLVKQFAPAMRLRRYVQHHVFDEARFAGMAAARRSPDSFDGIAELGWESMDDLLANGSDPAAADAARKLLADEKLFIDLPRSPIFFAAENVVL